MTKEISARVKRLFELREHSLYQLFLWWLPGASIIVALAWGDNPDKKEIVILEPLTASDWKYPVNFASGAITGSGRIEINGTETGVFLIGDRDKRASRYDYAWICKEPNDTGTDEFIQLCRLLRMDPYIIVNIGYGDATTAGE
jgi:hypothetical protein